MIMTMMMHSDDDDASWAGILATTQQPFRPHMDHGAYLPLDRGQQVTILAPPFWVWRDLDMLAGTYMVPVANFTPHRANPTPTIPPGDDHSPTTSPPGTAPCSGMALLGLVPLACFVHETD